MNRTQREREAASKLARMGFKANLMAPHQVAGRRLLKALEAAEQALADFLLRFGNTPTGEELSRLAEPFEDALGELNSKIYLNPVELLAEVSEDIREFHNAKV